MKRKHLTKTNGTVFKTIVREVVKDEVVILEKKLRSNLKEELEIVEQRLKNRLVDLEEKFDNKLDSTFRKYRDDVLTKMDEVVGELKTYREEQAAHQLQHGDINERLEKLVATRPR